MDNMYSQLDSTQDSTHNEKCDAVSLGVSFDALPALNKSNQASEQDMAKFGNMQLEAEKTGDSRKGAEVPVITDAQRRQLVSEIAEGRFTPALEDAFKRAAMGGLAGIRELTQQLNRDLAQTSSPNRIDIIARINPRTGDGTAGVYISDRLGGEPIGGKALILSWGNK